MKTSGAKIIIKPRLGKDDPIPLPEPDGPESEEDADMPDDETVDQATPGDAASENASGDLNDADDGDDGELEDEGDVITTGKGRGRPRGRGKAPTITAGRVKGKLRAVIKGRGRGRGRGGPLTIRLPGRQDDENQGDGEVAEAGKEVAVEEVEEKEEPLGGGKPFRKIQGKVYIIENDEFITDDDPKGDTKMDANGVLLGGRFISLMFLQKFNYFSIIQAGGLRLLHSYFQIDIQSVDICLPSTQHARLGFVILYTISGGTSSPSSLMPHSQKKSILLRLGS